MRWLVRGALLFLLAFADLNDIRSPDVVPNALFAWTLLREGNVDYDEFVTTPEPSVRSVPPALRLPREAYFFRACGRSTFTGTPSEPRSSGGPPPPGPNDRVCSVFPPGIGLLALPVLAPFVLSGATPSDETLVIRGGHLAAALIETLAALLLWSVVARFASARWAVALILLYWLATSVRTVASHALWQHAGVHLAIAAALWLVLHERAVPLRRELVAAAALGFGVVVRQTTAVVGLAMFRLGRRPIRERLALLAALGLGALPLVLYSAIAFGSPLEQGYGEKPFDGPLALGVYGLLLSPSRGLLVYEPYLVFGLAALVLAWRRPGLVAERLRDLSLSWVALLILYAGYAEWWGGRVFGPRFLDDLAPVLFAALAWGIGQGFLSRVWARIAFWIAAAWSLLLFNVAALVYDPNGWDTFPTNVNFDPSRLFSWSDPQWLAVLTSLGSADLRVLAAAVISVLLLALLLRFELRYAEADRREAG